MDDHLIAGIDEAGRGPVLGPLVIACVWATAADIQRLEGAGVRDSKKLSPSRREYLAHVIERMGLATKVVPISASLIDKLMRQGTNLNQIEFKYMVEAAKGGPLAHEIIIDAVDVKPDRFAAKFQVEFPDVKVTAEHKADDNHTVVAAASIVAKTTRDRMVEEITETVGQNIGSGYPGDKVTRAFLTDHYKSHGSFPNFVRHGWKTVQLIIDACDS